MNEHAQTGIRLGPYEILSELGEGGMGRVWKARHIHTGREVALKAITTQRAASASYRRAFRREAEAVARVDHPFVTTIYDFGETTSEEAAASDGQLRNGAPWLAMEYCDSGSMADEPNRPRSARMLQEVLAETLEALGYAHSRGIIHRDLKPENILVQRDDDGDRQIRIADFGIAQAVSETLLAENTAQISAARAGTPTYMAPEQIVAEWRNWGTWTDLYALGVIAYEWASGRVPFQADNWIAIGQLHLQAPPPPMEPLFALPQPFHNWIRRLLAKAPYERYERAADALYALQQIEIVDDLTSTGELPSSVWASAETNVFLGADADATQESGPLTPTAEGTTPDTFGAATTMTLAAGFQPATDSALNYLDASGDERAFHRSYTDVPPMPQDWRSTRVGKAAEILAGGVSLFGLREVPLVGREDARDLLWSTLANVRRTSRPALTVIEGDAGVGKSAMARWFTQRADETGAGFILHANHDESAPPGDGLRRMLATIVRGHGLNRRQLHDRIALLHHFFGDPRTREHDVPALTQLILPRRSGDVEDGVPRFQFPTLESRFETATRLIRHLARVRPIVIWLDDIHWSGVAIRFIHYLLNSWSDSASIHLVATVRTDLAEQMRRRRTQIEQICEAERATRMTVGPLPTTDMEALVDELVRLDPDLRKVIVEAAEGRPVHAVQLIGHVVEKTALQPGNSGYRLADNAIVPANIENLWILRVEEALSSTQSPVAALQAITLAALLGMRIERDTWVQICTRTGVGAADEVLENFATAGLLEPAPGGASRLRHDLLRFALQRNAQQTSEWNMFQWMCADILNVVEPPSPDREFRRAQHLVKGSFHREALEILMTELNHSVIDTRIPLLKDATELAERVLNEATEGKSMADPRWGQVQASRLVVEGAANSSDPASEERIHSLLRWAEDHDDPRTIADAHQFAAERMIQLGDPISATDSIIRCLEASKLANDPRRQARALNILAMLTNEAHDHERAKVYATQAVGLLREIGRDMRLGWALLTLANIHCQLGDFATAEQLATESESIFRDQGAGAGQASAIVVSAQVYRYSGRLIQAVAAAERALDVAQMAGLGGHHMASLVLIATLVERGEHERARILFDTHAERLRDAGLRQYLAHVEASAMTSFVALGELDRFDEAFEASWSFWNEGNFDSDVPRMFALATDYLERAQQHERATRVRERLQTYRRMVQTNMIQLRERHE